MKMFYYLAPSPRSEWDDKRTARVKAMFSDDKENLQIIYGNESTGNDNPNLYIPYLLEKIPEESTLIFDHIHDIAFNNREEVIINYQRFYERHIYLSFISEPMLSTLNLLELFNIIQGKYNFDEIDEATFMRVVKNQVTQYYNYRRQDLIGRRAMMHVSVEYGSNPIGRQKGAVIETEKAEKSKQKILEKSISFNGTMRDPDLIKELGISRNSFYKYKAELRKQHEQETANLELKAAN